MKPDFKKSESISVLHTYLSDDAIKTGGVLFL